MDHDQHERLIDDENPNADAKEVFHGSLLVVGRSQRVAAIGGNQKSPQGRGAWGASLLGGYVREGTSVGALNTPQYFISLRILFI